MPEFSGSSGKQESFQIPSMILEAGWIEKEGSVGATVGIQVRTVYVSHGAPISVTLKNREGKTLEKIDGVVYADMFRKKILLTKETAGGVFFEVELPKHNLKATGPRLNVKPLIRLYEPKWKDKAKGVEPAKIKRGADLLVEVKTENIPEDAEGRVTFKERLSPTLVKELVSVPCTVKDKKLSLTWRFEYEKETISLSSKAEKSRTSEEYRHPKIFFEAACMGATVNGPEVDFIDGVFVEIIDGEGKPVPKQKVKLTLPDGKTQELESDDEGEILVEDVAPGEVKLEILPREEEEEEEEEKEESAEEESDDDSDEEKDSTEEDEESPEEEASEEDEDKDEDEDEEKEEETDEGSDEESEDEDEEDEDDSEEEDGDEDEEEKKEPQQLPKDFTV